MEFPEYASRMIGRLRQAGFSAYAVGGCVRDVLLGRVPGDWDITTSALPEETAALFDTPDFQVRIDNGIRHGTVTVSVSGERIQACEITTFRTDGVYTDHRRPDFVSFVADLGEDLARRDFTVNAMAACPALDGLAAEFHDPFGGREDLAAGVLRCVGDPSRRFEEDALRILRGLRFAARYGFTVEERTADAMHSLSPLLRHIAPERIGTELCGILQGEHAGRVAEQFEDIFASLLPGCRCAGADSLLAGVSDWRLRLAILCREGDGDGVRATLLRYALGGDTADLVRTWLVWRSAPMETRRDLCRIADKFGEEGTVQYFAFRRAISGGDDFLWQAERQIQALFAPGVCYNVATLAIDGRALREEAGILPGPALGMMLRTLAERVIDGLLPNEKNALLAVTRTLRDEKDSG